ncbi:orotidine-5'-phosphate decarboxylase [Bryobacter aggregatus]|uniref:orotidine-5'-phosphate decarboxylase n=1 Tax=Bryobacter aggregatus TaxID=360054 RepID=UPI000B003888|nr:orotidine-5'-phosphate decarboxylase [Bryobacter aggregatus]
MDWPRRKGLTPLATLPHHPIIVALDVENSAQALDLIDKLGDSVDFYKVGMELFAAEGTSIVREILGRQKKVFLDLKFHDIPETVKRAVARAAELGVHLLTVHAHRQVMEAAVAGKAGSDLKVLGVTVLTSIGENDLADMGYPNGTTIAGLVQQRVGLGMDAGVDGFVCSPLEVGSVRQQTGSSKILVTPGVRSAGKDQGDQKRVATPQQAMADGASYLVIGRQITRSANPKIEAEAIQREISQPMG